MKELVNTLEYLKLHPEVLQPGKTIYFLDHGKWFWGEFENELALDTFMINQRSCYNGKI